MNKKRPRATIYMADREAGMTYREIAEKHGVSYQAVAQACAQYSPGHFRPYTAEQVVYPRLLRWLNENKVSRSEFCRRLDNRASDKNMQCIHGWFTGKHYPHKKVIDRILEITGLTYEELWEVDCCE